MKKTVTILFVLTGLIINGFAEDEWHHYQLNTDVELKDFVSVQYTNKVFKVTFLKTVWIAASHYLYSSPSQEDVHKNTGDEDFIRQGFGALENTFSDYKRQSKEGVIEAGETLTIPCTRCYLIPKNRLVRSRSTRAIEGRSVWFSKGKSCLLIMIIYTDCVLTNGCILNYK